MCKDTSCVCAKMSVCLEVSYYWEKTSMKTVETTKTGLRTAQWGRKVGYLCRFSHCQYLGENVLQHWAEINLVTLQKRIDTVPQQMCTVIKGGLICNQMCTVKRVIHTVDVPFFQWLFFGPGRIFIQYKILCKEQNIHVFLCWNMWGLDAKIRVVLSN